MKIALVGDIPIKNLIAPFDNGGVANTLYREAADVDTKDIVKRLNMINNQGITDINIKYLTYTIKDTTLPLTAMSTSEKLFLLSSLAEYTGVKIIVARYMEQLSYRVLKLYLDMFKDTDSITVLAESSFDLVWVLGRELCLV